MTYICIILVFLFGFSFSSDFDEKTDQTRMPSNEILGPGVTAESYDEHDECGDKISRKNCSALSYHCMNCSHSYKLPCVYGDLYNITCTIHENVNCLGGRTINKVAKCQFCWQTEKWEHACDRKYNCMAISSPHQYYKTNCTVNNDIICFGSRRFTKKLKCNWTRGHKWSTALLLSITLGGFGADRFYLGHWQEGIGKLISFGGIGIWTLIDVLLISIRYLGPADGSFYV